MSRTVARINGPAPTLVIIRGNSGSGKTSTAREVRRRYGRGCALLEQDYLRRIVLREHGSNSTPTAAPGFIVAVARAALAAGFHVVLEGMLQTASYGEPLRRLIAEHPGPSFVFWLDVSFAETVRRHERRTEPPQFTAADMRAWYTPGDVLRVPGEQVIAEPAGFEQTVAAILHGSGLAAASPLTPCPVRCPRCAEERRPDPTTAAAETVGAVNPVDRTATSPAGGRPGDEVDIWDAVAGARSWLDEHNGTAPTEIGLRILKIVEEAGEAAAAWIGTTGQNPRKGVTHEVQDVVDELGDVAFTALVAAASLGHDPHEVLTQVARKFRTRRTTVPAASAVGHRQAAGQGVDQSAPTAGGVAEAR
jgi:NTP pyrophosphatase (non-canonical NTP hydrolase)/predicted kinase